MKKYLILLLVVISALSARTALTELDDAFSSPRSVALGMAGAADGRPDDIFQNQFGLADLKNFGFYVSSYQLFSEVQYFNGTVYIPVGNAAGLGLGYKMRSVSDVLLTPADMLDASGRPDLSRREYLNYQQGVFYLAAGYRLEKFLGLSALDLAAAYKNYAISNSAADQPKLTAQGNNLDVGLRFRFNDFYSASLLGRNIIAGSGVNGSLVWQNGTAEGMLRSIVWGNRFAFAEDKLIFLLDASYFADESSLPALVYAGAEHQINSLLTLRGGIRQYTLLTGSTEQRVFNAVSAGLRLTPWQGIHLDYAYYPGDALALPAVHYVGAGLDLSDLFSRPDAASPSAESLQIMNPPDYLVLETDTLECVLQIYGYPTVNINEQEYTLNPRNKVFAVSLNLQPGENIIQISAGDRLLRRNVLRLQTQAELLAARQDKDILQTVFTPEQRLDFQDKKISLADFSAYVVQTLCLHLPPDFNGFNDLDILYFKGLLGKTSEGLTTQTGAFTLGRLAEILARIDGYADILDSNDDPQIAAVEVLIATGCYTPADFTPLTAEVTLAVAQSLLMRTSAVSNRLEREFAGYPLVWLDRAGTEREEIFLRFYNAERFTEWSWPERSSAGALQETGYYAQKVPLGIMKDGMVTLNVYDKSGKHWQFNARQTLPLAELSRPETEKTKEPEISDTTGGKISVAGAQPKILAKLSAERVKPGETLYIYAGIVARGRAVKEVKIIHPGHQGVSAKQYTANIWRAELKEFTAGPNAYRVLAVFDDGTTVEQDGIFFYDILVPRKIPALTPKKNVPPKSAERRLNKVYYPVEIMLAPAKPAAGAKIQIKARYAAELKKVYAVIRKQTIPLQKKNGLWQAEYTLPSRSQEVYIQIYAEDAADNLSMTEKVIKI